MIKALRFIALAGLVWMIEGNTAFAQKSGATLVINNNTGATLRISVWSPNFEPLNDGEEDILAILVAPKSIGEIRVPHQQIRVVAEASRMRDFPTNAFDLNVGGSGRYEAEIFAGNFGLSAMFDRPGDGDRGRRRHCLACRIAKSGYVEID